LLLHELYRLGDDLRQDHLLCHRQDLEGRWMNDAPRDALQRLIRDRMRELHYSYGDVARLGRLPRSTVHHLATHGRSGRLPHPATLERLAPGLNLPLSVVRAAAAASSPGLILDSQASDDPEIDVLVASLGRLSPTDRRHVAALVRSMLARAGPTP
jgi:hypothetical protein